MTIGEKIIVASIFGEAIDCDPVRIRRKRWFPLQPAKVVMAPCGHLHFPGSSPWYCDDFSIAPLELQGLFIHEMTHVWQTQKHGRWYLPLHRHPFCRYSYSLRPGWPLSRYGIEQQAEIVRHAFLLGQGISLAGAASLESYRAMLPFASDQQRLSQ